MRLYSKADKTRRELKNNITFGNVKKHLEKIGYTVLLGGTENTKKELQRYLLTQYAEDKPAFTYCGLAKFIYVDGSYPEQEKLLFLLHELGHICDDDDSDCNDKQNIAAEIRADAFAHEVFTGEHIRKVHKIAAVFLVAFFCMAFSVTSLIPHFYPQHQTDDGKNTVQAFAHQDIDTENGAEELFYVLPTGTKYHREDCQYVTSNAIAVSQEIAAKSYSPCKICRPDENN